jgi:hypothetical protein
MKKTAKPKLAMKKAVAKPAMKGPSKTSNLKSYKFMPSKEYVAKKASPAKAPVKAASKPTTKVAAKPMKRLTLPEVTVTATRIKKAAPVDTLATKQASKPKLRPTYRQAPDTIPKQAKLYPYGHVQQYKVDSLQKANKIKLENLKGKSGLGESPLIGGVYGEGESQYIRKKLGMLPKADPNNSRTLSQMKLDNSKSGPQYGKIDNSYAGVRRGKHDYKLEVRNKVADYMNYADTAKNPTYFRLNQLKKEIDDAKAQLQKSLEKKK